MSYTQTTLGSTSPGNTTVNTLGTEVYVPAGWGKIGQQLDQIDGSSGKGNPWKRLQSGLDASKPAAGSAGTVYVATDTKLMYYDDGAALHKIGGVDVAQTWTALQTLTGGLTATGTVDLSGATSLGTKVLDLVFTDETAPAAPGAGKTAIYTVSGVPHYRAGAAGADTSLAPAASVFQIQFQAAANSTAAGATAYFGGGTSSSGETNSQFPMSEAVTIAKLYVFQQVAAGSGQSDTYTLRKNNADTAITCAISGASATTANDTAHSVAYAAGDFVACKVVASGSAATVIPGASAGT